MTPLLALLLFASFILTAFLSGLFGLVGGMILVGILLAIMPLPEALVLHAIAQIAANSWRGILWVRHARWRIVIVYVAGCLLAFGVWSLWGFVPSKSLALILLGLTPFLIRLAPKKIGLNPESQFQGALCGIASMSLNLLTGVAGPLLDTFFLTGKLGRREIVATKAICQVFGHAAKLAYFGGVIDQAASLDSQLAVLAIVASLIGTLFTRPVLDRMTDRQFRVWANRIITAVAIYYLAYGTLLLTLL